MLWWTLQQLKSSKAQSRLEAARKLGAVREWKAVPALLDTLRDADTEVRFAAIGALGAIAHPASAEPLAAAVAEIARRTPLERASAAAEYEHLAAALGGVGKPALRPVLQLLRSEDTEVRRWAAVVLGRIRDPEAVDPLAEKLHDSRSEVRKCAADALGLIADHRGIPFLIKSLSHKDPETRRASADALGRIASGAAVDALARATTDSTESVQIEAANALGRISGLRSATALRAAAESGRKGLRDAALASLRDMAFTPESAGDRAAFFVLVGDFEGAVRAGEIAGTALIGAISSRDATRRREAASALGKLKLSSSVNPLLKLLRDHDPEVQRASADALIEIGGSAIEGLMALLECPDPSAQRESARALGRIADPRAAGPLVELIRGNRRTTGDYPEPLEAARAAAESLITILTRSADSIPPETLARIAEVPDCIVVQGQAGVEEVALDCSPIRKLVNRDTDGR